MLSTLQALAECDHPSLPEDYIGGAANSIRRLARAVAVALSSSLKRWVGSQELCSVAGAQNLDIGIRFLSRRYLP